MVKKSNHLILSLPTYQNSRSQNASKVPDFFRDVRFVLRCSSREEEQDVAQNADAGQREQADPQTFGKRT